MHPILPAEPTPAVATTTAATQIPVIKSAGTSIPVNVYNLGQGKFEGIPYPSGRPQEEENPSSPSCNMPQKRQQLEATPTVTTCQVRENTQWPNTVPVSRNLFEARENWSIPPTERPTVKIKKTEAPPRVATIPHAMVLNKPQNNRPAEEKCTWGPHYTICKKEEGTEDWDSDRGENQQRIFSADQAGKGMEWEIRMSQQNIMWTTTLAPNQILTEPEHKYKTLM